MTNIEEIIERTVDRLDKTKCLSDKLDFTMAGMIINTAIQEANKTTWTEQLQQAKQTLSILRGSIRGESPSQVKMSDKLKEVIEILNVHITVAEVTREDWCASLDYGEAPPK